jgi:hypothetical protein
MDETLYWLEESDWGWYVGIGETSGVIRCLLSLENDVDVGHLVGTKKGDIRNVKGQLPEGIEWLEINTIDDGVIFVDEMILKDDPKLQKENHINQDIKRRRWRRESDVLKSVILNYVSNGSLLLDLCSRFADNTIILSRNLPIPPIAVVRRWMLKDPAFHAGFKIAESIRAGVFHDKAMTEDASGDPEIMKEARSRFTWGAEVGDRKKYSPKPPEDDKKKDNSVKLIVVNTGIDRLPIDSATLKTITSNDESSSSSSNHQDD